MANTNSKSKYAKWKQRRRVDKKLDELMGDYYPSMVRTLEDRLIPVPKGVEGHIEGFRWLFEMMYTASLYRSSKRLEGFSRVLIFLTVALVFLTLILAWKTFI